MDWFKLSTKLPRDPKWKLLSSKAKVGYVEAICEVAEQETDGLLHGKHTKIGAEWVGAGLAVETETGYELTAYLKWNPSRAELETRRVTGAKRVQKHRSNGVTNGEHSSTEVEVEVEVEKRRKAKAASRAVPANRPDDDQQYLAEKLGAETGITLSIPALQKLNAIYGRTAITDALRYVRGFPPEIGVRNPYAYVEAIAKDRVGAA